MSQSLDSIDRARVERDTRPSQGLGPDQLGVLWCLVCALLFGAGAWLGWQARSDASWYAMPQGLLFAAAGFALLFALALGQDLQRRRRRHRLLDECGVEHPVDRLRTLPLRWGSSRGGRGRTRWIIVADWRDSLGRSQNAAAGPFDYDPAPLLMPPSLQVRATRDDPGLCRIDGDGLPPRHRHRLSPTQRAAVTLPGAIPPWVAALLVLLMTGLVAAWLAAPMLIDTVSRPG